MQIAERRLPVMEKRGPKLKIFDYPPFQKVTNRRAKSYFSEGKKLLFEGRKVTFCDGLPVRGGCGGRGRVSRSRATCSGCTPDGTCPSSCVLISSGAATARIAYIASVPYTLNIKDQKGRSLLRSGASKASCCCSGARALQSERSYSRRERLSSRVPTKRPHVLS